jgi:hypothetical protein
LTEKVSERLLARIAPPGPPRLRAPAWWPVVPPAVLAVAGAVLFLVSLRGLRLAGMNGLGLISVLPAGALAGAVLLAVGFVLALAVARPYPIVLGGMLVVLVVCLDGAAAFTEAEPRFATAYQIAGFVDYISRNHHAAPDLDAYFSWPGFFALIAFLEGAVGKHDLLPVLRFWPMGIDLLYLVPLGLMLRNLRATWRARWFAAFLFIVGNWVGQDYFSPQAFNYLLYLIFLAILVNWFLDPSPPPRARPRGPGRLARLHRRVFGDCEPGELPARPVSTGTRVTLLLLVFVICVISTTSHQLTPFYLLVSSGGLVLVRRLPLRSLPVLIGVIAVGWVSFYTVAYWSGHMANIFGGFGNLGANVTSSIGGRMTGSTQAHLQVLHGRVLVPGALVLLALAGFLRRRLRQVDDRSALVLLCVPLLSVGVQNYGGEIALRIFLFMLAPAAFLAACLFFPETSDVPRTAGASWRGMVKAAWPAIPLAAACASVFVIAFFLVRYGNEAFEQSPPGEVSAMNYVYAHDSGGIRLMWLSEAPQYDDTPQMPWASQDDQKIDYVPILAPQAPGSTAAVVRTIRAAGPGTYLIDTLTQDNYLEQAAGYQAGWGRQFHAAMSVTPGVRVVYHDSTAVIYTLHWPPGTKANPPNLSINGPPLQAGLLTPIGLAVFGLAILALLALELVRITVPSPDRLLRPLSWTSLVLVVALAGIVLARFALLA